MNLPLPARRGGPPARDDLPGYALLLRAARQRAGLTQQQVSLRAGTAPGRYGRVENPSPTRPVPSGTCLNRWCVAVGLTGQETRDVLDAADLARNTPPARRPTRQPPEQGPASPRPPWSALLRQYRTDRGLTGAETARRMGVSPQTYAGLETGTRLRDGQPVPTRFKDETVARIGTALRLNPAERRALDQVAHAPWSGNTEPWQNALRQARLAARLTLADAAALAGIREDSYRRWETAPRSGGPDRQALDRFLNNPAVPERHRNEVLNALPAPVRVQPPTEPARTGAPPEWSRLLTAARVSAGLHLADVDRIVGTPGAVRRFELGGWPRTDGRLTVPPRTWLDRIADATAMTAADRTALHRAADQQRIANAATGSRPLPAALLEECRRAAGLTRTQAAHATGLGPAYNRLEAGTSANALRKPGTPQRIAAALGASPALTRALSAAARTGRPSAHRTTNSPDRTARPVGHAV